MKLTYKYIIYKVYSWTYKKNADTPIANTIFVLGSVHFFQFLTILLFIDQIITPLDWIWKLNRIYLFISAIIYFVLFYLIVYNKNKWDSYVNEFKNETEQNRRSGNYFVMAYLILSILLFFLSLPILFSIGRHLHVITH
jgi:glucan phosphoethanolaminetransferase (alkaline phosphatase superfamily)